MWAYAPEQEVSLGKEWTADEVPADVGRAWLSSGIVEAVAGAPKAPVKKVAR